MGAVTTVPGATNFVLQEAISAMSHEAYTNAKKLSGTGIVGSNPDIDTSTETFIGQVRWYKPMTATINVASLTAATAGTGSTYSQDFLEYIKTVRTYGGTKINLQQIVTQEDGLAKISMDFAEHRSQDEHNAILAVLKGVAITEVLYGAGYSAGANGLGGQSWSNDPTDKKYGFYVDLGTTVTPIQAASASLQGAARAQYFLDAIGKGWKDYEPEYAYLIASPETMASLRSANLVDQDRVQDGGIMFNTIFQGKFRLIQTRASQGIASAEFTKLNLGPGVDLAGTAANSKTTYIVLPGAVAMAQLAIPEPVEIERSASTYGGGGSTSIWNRWGYVLLPAGYDWNGGTGRFPSDAQYAYVVDSAATTGGTPADPEPTVADAHTAGAIAGGVCQKLDDLSAWANTVRGTWTRKTASALSLGILPVFHG